MDESAFDEMLARLKRLGRWRRRRLRVYMWLVPTAGAVWLVVHFVCLTGKWTTGHFPWWFYLSACLFVALLGALLVEQLRRHGEEMDLVRRVTECDDLRAVGAFVDELGQLDYHTYPAVVKCLTRLLPRLGDDDGGRLGEVHRGRLRAVLRDAAEPTSPQYDVAFAEAVMRALGRLGDTRALPVLRRFAEADGPKDERDPLREAARTAMADMERRRQSSRLVRPSVLPPERSLLRPAAGSEGVPAEQMVRPHPPGT